MGYQEDPYLESNYLEAQEPSMVDRSKLLFVGADGNYVEASAADSLLYASYKTASYELTDALLGDVTNLMIKSDGSRAFAADQSFGGFKLTNVAAGSADTDGVSFGQVKGLLDGISHKSPARVASTVNIDISSAPASIDGVTMAQDDRVLLTGQTLPAENGIYVYNGSAAAMTRSSDLDENSELVDGVMVSIKEGTKATHRYIMTSDDPLTIGTSAQTWEDFPFTLLNGGDGIEVVGDQINVDLLASGGLKFVGGEVGVEPTDFAGLGLEDDGSDNLAIDFADPATEMGTSRAVAASDLNGNGANQGAKILGYDPSSNPHTSATLLQGALDDMAAAISEDDSVSYVTGSGVAQGDVVKITGNDQADKMPISGAGSETQAIGIAHAAAAAAGSFRVLSDDEIVAGVLTALTPTAGDKVYWDGSALTLTAPTGGGSLVVEAGFAKNANDLHTKLRIVKRNS